MSVHQFIELTGGYSRFLCSILDDALALIQQTGEVLLFKLVDGDLACFLKWQVGFDRCGHHFALCVDKVGRETIGLKNLAGFQNAGSFDDVFQFPNVARPVVSLKNIQDVRVYPFDLRIQLPIELTDEFFGESRQVFLSFPERRDANWEDIESIKQITPELSFLTKLSHVFIGRRDDAYINGDIVLAADALENAFLNDVEQLDLNRLADRADFVQKDGPAVGQFKLAQLAPDSAGK